MKKTEARRSLEQLTDKDVNLIDDDCGHRSLCQQCNEFAVRVHRYAERWMVLAGAVEAALNRAKATLENKPDDDGGDLTITLQMGVPVEPGVEPTASELIDLAIGAASTVSREAWEVKSVTPAKRTKYIGGKHERLARGGKVVWLR